MTLIFCIVSIILTFVCIVGLQFEETEDVSTTILGWLAGAWVALMVGTILVLISGLQC